MEKIDTAVRNLYGSWDGITEFSKEVLLCAIEMEDIDELLLFFNEQQMEESINKRIIINAEKYSDEKVTEANIDDVIKSAHERRHMERVKKEKMDTILKVFTDVGVEKTKADAYDELLKFYEGDPFAPNKAAGSLGGAVNGGTLVFEDDMYKRVR